MRPKIDGSKQQEYGEALSDAEIIVLKKESAQRSGRWEIDWGPEPLSLALGGVEGGLTLTMVVHQESYYIIETHVSPSDEKSKGVSTFITALKKEFKLPDTVVVRDKILRDELMPLAVVLDFKIEVGRLKAIPEVRRGIKQMLG